MNITVTSGGDYVVSGNYATDMNSQVKLLGGSWNDYAGAWVFPASCRSVVFDFVEREWGLGEPDTDVWVEQTSDWYGQVMFYGYFLSKTINGVLHCVDALDVDDVENDKGQKIAKWRIRVPAAWAARKKLELATMAATPPGPVAPPVNYATIHLSGFTSKELEDELARRQAAARASVGKPALVAGSKP